MVTRNPQQTGYGLSSALQSLAPRPIVSNVPPNANIRASYGQIYIDENTNTVYAATSFSAAGTTWTQLSN